MFGDQALTSCGEQLRQGVDLAADAGLEGTPQHGGTIVFSHDSSSLNLW